MWLVTVLSSCLPLAPRTLAGEENNPFCLKCALQSRRETEASQAVFPDSCRVWELLWRLTLSRYPRELHVIVLQQAYTNCAPFPNKWKRKGLPCTLPPALQIHPQFWMPCGSCIDKPGQAGWALSTLVWRKVTLLMARGLEQG